jgi:hypothetical protein
VVLTRAYPITASAVPSLSHNPVELWVLILEVMRRVFKTRGGRLALESDPVAQESSQSHQPIVFETCGEGVCHSAPPDVTYGLAWEHGPGAGPKLAAGGEA